MIDPHTEAFEMTQFVLLPGAWIGAWAWRDVATQLRAAGHEAFPVTLTGLGDRSHLARRDVDLETHVSDVLQLIEFEDLADLVLVGHSYGGLVAQVVADRMTERVATVVYLDTGPLPDGWSMLDFAGPEGRADLERSVDERGDGWLLPFPGVENLGAPSATADFDDRVRDLLANKATAQPFGTYRQPVRMGGAFGGEHRRVAIVAGGFGMPASQLQALIAAGAPPFAAMTGSDWEFVDLDTGHWPMLTAPDELASALLHVAASSKAPASAARS